MEIAKTDIKDCVLIQPKHYGDNRGMNVELYNATRYKEAGIDHNWTQSNCSRSNSKVIRGIHVVPFAKLVTCMSGCVYDVVVDTRPDSPTYLKWLGFLLRPEEMMQVYVPPGCGHGFYSFAQGSVVVYLQSQEYDPKLEKTIIWNDPTIGIEWPKSDNYILSTKDQQAQGIKNDLKGSNPSGNP